MYCVNCGVKLADTEKQCPLCQTSVYHPEIEPRQVAGTYPEKRYPKDEPHSLGLPVLATAMILIPFLMVLFSDLWENKGITWSGYVMGALVLGYIIFILPLWFKKSYPVIFVPCWFVAAGLYLLYINYATGSHWFLGFAFPVLCSSGVIITTVVVLLQYVRRGKLYIFGGATMAVGAVIPLIEILLSHTFPKSQFIGWSFYPLASLVLIGGLLIFLGICRPAREYMERKFFV